MVFFLSIAFWVVVRKVFSVIVSNLFGILKNVLIIQYYLIDMLNENHFNPVPGEGENGKPVVVPARDVLKMQQVFQVNRFNLMASDRMSLNRTVPDVRREKCRTRRDYDPKSLPDTSIIIVFHNEAWSVLLRTVWSVINRSPRHLVKEILLVDDASDRSKKLHVKVIGWSRKNCQIY